MQYLTSNRPVVMMISKVGGGGRGVIVLKKNPPPIVDLKKNIKKNNLATRPKKV